MRRDLLITMAIVPSVFKGVELYSQQNHNRPNILFCIADDATYQHFSANGCSWISTPNFDRVATQGVLFANCYTPNAKSGPSRSCILTGRNSWQLNEAGNHLSNFPEEFTVFTESLEQNGYSVASTGKGWAPGNPGVKDGAPRRLTGTVYNSKKLTPPTSNISAIDYAANFADFLNQTPADTPWFFWMGSQEPHRAYEWQSGLGSGKRLDMIDRVPSFYPDCDSVRTDLLDYALEIEYFDKTIGALLDELERRGELNNTLVVITSDNGMPFPRVKANNYEYSNHMPCAMMWRDGIKSAGRIYQNYISFIDFTPTFLDLAAVCTDKSGMQPITGHSVVDILRDKESAESHKQRESIILGRERDDYGRPNNQGYPIRAIIRNGMLYIANLKPHLYPAGDALTGFLDIDGSPTKSVIIDMERRNIKQPFYELSFGLRGAEEMYDISKDADCMVNLASSPSYATQKQSLRNELENRLREQHDPRMFGRGDVFDNYPFDTPDKLNFYEKVHNREIKEPWRVTNWVNPSDYHLYFDERK